MISICGVKGSAGSSTLALLAAMCWPTRAVVVEADPAGGEFALTLAGPQGQALPAKPSIAELALSAAQRMPSVERVWAAALETAVGPVVCGIPSAEPMVKVLREYGRHLAAMLMGEPDVVVDAGRLSPGTASLPLLAASNVVAVVLPDRPESLFRLTDLLPGLASVLRVEDDVRSVIVPVVVATPHRGQAAAREVDEVLSEHHIPASAARWIGWDPKAAAAVRGGAARVQRSVLLRTSRSVVEALAGEQYAVSQQRAARARLASEQFSDAASQWRGMGHAPANGGGPVRHTGPRRGVVAYADADERGPASGDVPSGQRARARFGGARSWLNLSAVEVIVAGTVSITRSRVGCDVTLAPSCPISGAATRCPATRWPVMTSGSWRAI